MFPLLRSFSARGPLAFTQQALCHPPQRSNAPAQLRLGTRRPGIPYKHRKKYRNLSDGRGTPRARHLLCLPDDLSPLAWRAPCAVTGDIHEYPLSHCYPACRRGTRKRAYGSPGQVAGTKREEGALSRRASRTCTRTGGDFGPRPKFHLPDSGDRHEFPPTCLNVDPGWQHHDRCPHGAGKFDRPVCRPMRCRQ